MSYYGYNPAEFSRQRIALKQQAGQAVGQGLAKLGEIGANAVTQYKAQKKERTAEEEALAIAERDRQQFIKLSRMASEYVPGLNDFMAENGVKDPVELFPPVKSAKNIEQYSKALSEQKDALAQQLASSPNVNAEQLDKIMRMPGWTEQQRKVMRQRQLGEDVQRLTTPQGAPARTPTQLDNTGGALAGANAPRSPGMAKAQDTGLAGGTPEGTASQQLGITSPGMQPAPLGQYAAANTGSELQAGLAKTGRYTPEEQKQAVTTFQGDLREQRYQQQEQGRQSRAELRAAIDWQKLEDARAKYKEFANLDWAKLDQQKRHDKIAAAEALLKEYSITDLRRDNGYVKDDLNAATKRRDEVKKQGLDVGNNRELYEALGLQIQNLTRNATENAKTIAIADQLEAMITRYSGANNPPPAPTPRPNPNPNPNQTPAPGGGTTDTTVVAGTKNNPKKVTDAASYALVKPGEYYTAPDETGKMVLKQRPMVQ